MSPNGRDPSLANISELAVMFGKGRQTIRTKIQKSCIAPASKEGQTKLYRISEVAQALYAINAEVSDEDLDPESLRPSEQKDYWIAKHKELDFKARVKEYVLAEDVRKDYKLLQDNLKQQIQSFPDRLERDHGLKNEEVERMIGLCDQLQTSLMDIWND